MQLSFLAGCGEKFAPVYFSFQCTETTGGVGSVFCYESPICAVYVCLLGIDCQLLYRLLMRKQFLIQVPVTIFL